MEEIIINDRAKLENIKILLNYLIDTCKSEISITDKLIINARNNTDVSKLLKEKAFWEVRSCRICKVLCKIKMGFTMKIENKLWTRKVLCFFCRQQVIDNKCGCWLRNL